LAQAFLGSLPPEFDCPRPPVGGVEPRHPSMEQQGKQGTGTKLFVGNLPGDCNEEDLQSVFSHYGKVNHVHLMAPEPRKGNRCAFVFYDELQSAEDAIKVLDGVYKIRENAENPIKVTWPRDNDHSKGGKGGGGKGGGGGWGGDAADAGRPPPPEHPDGHRIFVGSLPEDVVDEELMSVFSTYGKVNGVNILKPAEGVSARAAFVTYAEYQSAEDAIKVLDGVYKIREDAEKPIKVSWPKQKDQGKGKGQGKFDNFGKGKGNYNDWQDNRGGNSGWQDRDRANSWQDRGGSSWQSNDRGGGGSDWGGKGGGGWQDRSNDRGDRGGGWQDRGNDRGGGGGGWQSNDRGGGGGGWQDRGGDRGYDRGGDRGGDWRGGSSGWQDDRDRRGGGGNWQDHGDRGGGSWGGKGSGKDEWRDRGDRGDSWGKGGGKDGGYSNYDKGGGKGGKVTSDTRLYVANLPEDIQENALEYVFKTYGSVKEVHLMTGKNQNGCIAGFVEMGASEEADIAIASLHEKYEIRSGFGPIIVRKASSKNRSAPY